MNDQELSRMMSLEAIANRYVAEADELRAKLRRLEALPAKLHAMAKDGRDDKVWTGLTTAAELVEEALGAEAVLQPSNPALDPVTKTGDKPGAETDDTSEVGGISEDCHLSSVVEQRFRKPLETREAESTSESKPVEARNAADGGVGDVDAAVSFILEGFRTRTLSPLDNAAVIAAREVRRLQAVVADQALTIGTLKDEVTRVREDRDAGAKDYCKLRDHSDAWQVRALNAEDELKSVRDEHHELLVRLRLEPKKSDIPYNGY